MHGVLLHCSTLHSELGDMEACRGQGCIHMYRWDVSMYRCTFVARTSRIRELTAAAGAGADTRSGPVSYALII